MELKHLVQEESVCFYVSTFQRSRQTFDHIRQSFHDEQVQLHITLHSLTLFLLNIISLVSVRPLR